jgi:hypothetical protein
MWVMPLLSPICLVLDSTQVARVPSSSRCASGKGMSQGLAGASRLRCECLAPFLSC